MSEPPAPDLLKRLDELTRWIDEGEGLVLGLDFDGTLAAIVDTPAESTLTPTARVALEEFASSQSVIPAVVSGRERDDLQQRVGVDDVVYAGNHGLELAYGDEELVHPEAETYRPTISRLCADIETRLRDVPGCTIEDKGLTATVHFRRVPDDAVPTVVSTVDQVVSNEDGVHVTEGKEIRELRPSVDWDKGRTMQLLRGVAPERWQTIYLGDDTTDEDAFRAVQPDGLGVRVTEPACDDRVTETAARYRIEGQETVSLLLAWVGMCLGPRSRRDLRPQPERSSFSTFTDMSSEGDVSSLSEWVCE